MKEANSVIVFGAFGLQDSKKVRMAHSKLVLPEPAGPQIAKLGKSKGTSTETSGPKFWMRSFIGGCFFPREKKLCSQKK